jgi:acyl-CoA thioester hydrolase
MALHVSMATRRTAPFPEDALARLEYVAKAHAPLPRPPQQGRVLGIPRV